MSCFPIWLFITEYEAYDDKTSHCCLETLGAVDMKRRSSVCWLSQINPINYFQCICVCDMSMTSYVDVQMLDWLGLRNKRDNFTDLSKVGTHQPTFTPSLKTSCRDYKVLASTWKACDIRLVSKFSVWCGQFCLSENACEMKPPTGYRTHLSAQPCLRLLLLFGPLAQFQPFWGREMQSLHLLCRHQ